MFKKIAPGQTYADSKRHRNLTVLELVMGDSGVPVHPQINYAKCRADYNSGEMGIAWVAVHALLGSEYRLI